MRRPSFIALWILLPAVVASADTVFKTENIFPVGPKHAHGSSIVECPNGDLLACWFYGSGERSADDVAIQGARRKKNASAWSPVFLMADTPGFPDCNPVLYIDRRDRVWLFWIPVLAHRWECAHLKYRRADDPAGDGALVWSWQDIIQLKPGEGFAQVMKEKFDQLQLRDGMWAEYAKPYTKLLLEAAQDPYKRQTGWMSRIHPITLPTGRVLLPLYSDGFNASLMAISDDDGATWRASAPIIGLGPIQPTVVRKKDGTLVAYCRDSGGPPGRAMVSTSTDDGATWSAAIDSDIPNPGSSLEAIVLNDGRWLMVCNDTEYGRRRLTAMLSSDEGKSWPLQRRIEPSDQAGRSFGYPSVIQTRDGLIHMTYTYQTETGKCIRHTTMNPEWITQSQ